jgi:hypothetical protein
MDAISTIGQRIAQIQALVADPAQAVSATSGGVSSSEGTFAAALATALADQAATGTTSLAGSSDTAASLLGGASDGSLLGALGLSTGTGSSLLGALGLSRSPGIDALSGVSDAAPAAAAPAAGLNADGVPAVLAAYGNGRIPAAALAPVGGSRMWEPAAQALTNLIAAAKADGVTIGVTEGYRPYEEQVTLAATKGLYSQGGLAAVPGTSEHGWGVAADLALDSAGLAWMRAHASAYGFRATVPRESWHWSYEPSA